MLIDVVCVADVAVAAVFVIAVIVYVRLVIVVVVVVGGVGGVGCCSCYVGCRCCGKLWCCRGRCCGVSCWCWCCYGGWIPPAAISVMVVFVVACVTVVVTNEGVAMLSFVLC